MTETIMRFGDRLLERLVPRMTALASGPCQCVRACCMKDGGLPALRGTYIDTVSAVRRARAAGTLAASRCRISGTGNGRASCGICKIRPSEPTWCRPVAVSRGSLVVRALKGREVS
jgi:hypothetical protein